MATLRDLVPGLDQSLAGLVPGSGPSPVQQGLRGPATALIEDEAEAAGMGQLRRGFTTGRLQADANALAADESAARAAGDTAAADALRLRIGGLQQRSKTFAPTEQDVTQLDWQPGRILDYGLATMGQGAASMTEPLATGIGANAAAGVLGLIPHPLAQGGAKALRAGGILGGGYLNYRQNKGEFYNQAVEDPALMAGRTAQEIDRAGAGHGLVAGALDTALPAWAANRIVPGGTKVLSGLGGGMKAALGLGGEAVTETLQGESKRGILGLLNPQRDTSGDAAERWNDAVGGAIGAAPIVGLSHLGDKANARLGVKDDTSSDDVSGGKTMPGAPKREKLTDSLKRGAAKYTDDDAAEKWNETLQGLHNPDQEVATTEQHAALLKELGGRVAKGDATAKLHIDALNKLDPADNATWFGAPERDAAYEHILGDGTDHAKVIEAYKSRKLNAQGGSDKATVRLAASILSSSLPENADQALHAEAKDIARELASFADVAEGRGKLHDPLKAQGVAQRIADVFPGKTAAALVAKVATAIGVETTPLFKQLQQNLAGAADIANVKKSGRTSRAAVGDQLVALIPASKQLALRNEGIDLTSPSYKAALVDYVEQLGKAISYGATDAKGEPVVVPPSAYAKLTAKVGAEAAVAMLDMVSPGKIIEKESDAPKENGGGTTGPAKESDREGEKRSGGLGDDLEMDDFDIDAAKKSMERAPGAKLYLTKGKRGIATAGDTEGAHPFVRDKKTGNLPKLSLADDTDTKSGFNTLEAMEERAYEMLTGKPWEPLPGDDLKDMETYWTSMQKTVEEGGTKVTRRTTQELSPGQYIKNDDPKAQPVLGVGSFRIRRISAKDVMDDRGVAAGRRTTLLRQYLAQDGVMGEGDDTLTQLNTLNRKIKEAEQTTPKQLTSVQGMRLNHGQLKLAVEAKDNPAYARLEELKALRTEVIAKLAKKIGVEAKDDATVEDLANTYFGQRFLITAEQMAEKDQLRLNQAEVLAMIRKGNQYINKSTDPTLGPSPVEVQAGMNLIRFRSKSAITKSDEKRGIAVIPASELVAWVFANRNDYKGVEGAKESALEFRNALMEGIGALAEGGYMDALPFMINAEGDIERFGSKKHGGFPPSLKLGGMKQADLNEEAKRNVAAIRAADEASKESLAKMSPKDRAKFEAAAEKKRSDEVARDQNKTETVRNTDPDELLAEGQERDPKTAARPVAQRSLNLVPPSTGKAGPHPVLMSAPAKEAPPARYWDAPAAEPTDPAIPTNPEFDNPLGTPDRRFVNGTEIQGDLPGMPEAPGPTAESVRPSAVGVSRPGQKTDSRRAGRFPVAPETVSTRRSDNARTQLDWDLKAQDGGVPTDFTAAQMAKSVADAALTEGESKPMTPTNATARAPALAREILWQLDSFDGMHDGKRVKSDVPADPQGAFQRVQRLVAALSRPASTTGSRPAGGKHYAAPLALILTSANVKVLISKAQNKAAAGPRLERMRDKVALALLTAGDNDLSLAGRVVAARALLGNDALTSVTMKAPLQAMADREEKRLAAERERAATAAAEQKAKIEAKKAGQPTKVKLNGTSTYVAKDQAKADKANKFIGRGSESSSTAQYAKDFGAAANTGTYVSTDRVFVSAEGKREGRVNPDRAELDKAVAAGVTFITDDAPNRERGYNVGERQIAKYLTENGYAETAPGEWTKAEAETAAPKLNAMRGPARAVTPTLEAVAKTRSLMTMLGFKTAPPQFVSLAGKLLTDPRVDVGQFIKDSAEALSHALMEGASGDAIRTAIDSSPAWLKERQKLVSRGFASGVGGKTAIGESYRKLAERIVAGELAPATPRERSITRTLAEAAKALVDAIKKMFGTPEFADVVREQLNAMFEQASKGPAIAEGHKKVKFQEAVDADPAAAQVLSYLSKNPNIALSGSIVLAHTGTIYRNAKNMLHDLDFSVQGAKDDADAYLKAKYAGALQVNDFYSKATNTSVATYIVPPPGAEVSDVTRQFGDKGGLTGYTVTKDGKVIGRKWTDKQGEHREGEAGVTVDFFTGPGAVPPSAVIPFTVDGEHHSIKALPASAIFDKKLAMGRDKDLKDFLQFTPNEGKKLNAMSARIHSELGRAGFPATHDSPIKHEGKFNWREHAMKGEGAMVKGAGTYLSTSDSVHKFYKGTFTAKVEPEYDYVAADRINVQFIKAVGARTEVSDNAAKIAVGKGKGEAVAFVQQTLDEHFKDGPEATISQAEFDKWTERYEKLLAAIKAMPESEMRPKRVDGFRNDKAPTYEVSVNIPQEQLLNWDKPLSEQSTRMQEVAKKVAGEGKIADLSLKWKQDADDLYTATDPDTFAIYTIQQVTPSKFILTDGIEEIVGIYSSLEQAKHEAEKVTFAGPDSDRKILNYRGEDFYRALSDHFAPGDRDTGDRQASDYLQAAGILGHRMKASAKDGTQNPNYVIYDDSKITTNYVHFNAETATKVSSDADVAEAIAYLKKTRGPEIMVEVSKDFPNAGEYLEAERLIKLSTAIGPGVLSVAYHEGLHDAWATVLKNHPGAREALSKVMSSPSWEAAQRLDAEIAQKQALIDSIAKSMENRPETGPDAEAAVGAKRAKISGLSEEIHAMRKRSERLKSQDSNSIFARLRSLLANEPEALAAITTGPHAAEERVAYAYQFWAAGELDVDKPATTLFAKFRKMLRKVLGMVRESETALDIMTALHDGKLAEPSAAGRVLKEIMARETWNADVKRKFDKVIQNSFAAIAPSNDVLRRETLSGTARLLGKIMFSNPGEEAAGGDQGYLNARKQKIAQYTNYLHAALKGLSERDLAEVAKQLQLKTPLEQITYAPVRDAVKGVRALTKRYYEYATQKSPHGEPVLKLEFLGEDHYPRVWDLRKLVDDGDGQTKFIAMLLQPKYKKPMAAAMAMANEGREKPFTAEQIALKMYERLVEKNGVDDKSADSDRMDDDLLDPFFASQKERSFKWLDDADVEPFLDKDVVSAMTRYLHQGIRAVEFSRRFGERGKFLRPLLVMKGDPVFNSETGKVEPAETHGRIASEMYESLKKAGTTGKEADLIVARHMDDVRKAVAAHEGSLGHTISPTWRKFSSAAMAYQNLRLLPLSLLVAFGDTIGIAARFGEGGGKLAFQAFTQGLRDVYARWKDAASDMPAERQKTVWENIAEMVGAVDSHMFLEQMGNAAASEFTTDWARKANRALFMVNGLTAWDRSMRVSATKAAVLFLQHHASLPDKQHSARWLKELGLKVEDIPLDADGKLIYDRHVLAAEKGISLEDATKQAEKVHYAITRWVEGAVLTPTAGQRPTWASDPHYAVLFHLKQFTYSFHHTILKRAYTEAGHGNMSPLGALMAAVPTMVAADLVKGVVVGGGSLPAYMQQWDLGDHMMHGFNRAGLGGIGQFGIDGLRDPFSVLGPTAQQASEFILNPLDIGHNLHNAVPGARYIKGLPDLARVAE
jgi:hypothetical protein